MITIKALPALRKIENIGQVTQAGIPRLDPEFFVLTSATSAADFRTSATLVAR
jgi:hypothetical protein